MVNNTTDIKFTAFNPFVNSPWIELTGPKLDTEKTRLSEGERFLVSAQIPGRERRLLTIERLPDTQWKEFRITISTPRVCEPGGSCAIGDAGPGGGIVFYDAGSTQSWGRYLEVALPGWSGKPNDPRVKFCAADQPGYDKQISTDAAVGTGRRNTVNAARECGGGTTAPSLAANYAGGGKKDWFIPSINELRVLFEAISGPEGDLFNGFDRDRTRDAYWSSTNSARIDRAVSVLNLWAGWDWEEAGDGAQWDKTAEVSLRPIRAF
jgi:hypothetical protein